MFLIVTGNLEAGIKYQCIPKDEFESLKAGHICEWGHSKGYDDEVDETGVYFTSCDHSWEFMEGGIAENHVKYCPYCGGKIVEQALKEASEI